MKPVIVQLKNTMLVSFDYDYHINTASNDFFYNKK